MWYNNHFPDNLMFHLRQTHIGKSSVPSFLSSHFWRGGERRMESDSDNPVPPLIHSQHNHLFSSYRYQSTNGGRGMATLVFAPQQRGFQVRTLFLLLQNPLSSYSNSSIQCLTETIQLWLKAAADSLHNTLCNIFVYQTPLFLQHNPHQLAPSLSEPEGISLLYSSASVSASECL